MNQATFWHILKEDFEHKLECHQRLIKKHGLDYANESFRKHFANAGAEVVETELTDSDEHLQALMEYSCCAVFGFYLALDAAGIQDAVFVDLLPPASAGEVRQ